MDMMELALRKLVSSMAFFEDGRVQVHSETAEALREAIDLTNAPEFLAALSPVGMEEIEEALVAYGNAVIAHGRMNVGKSVQYANLMGVIKAFSIGTPQWVQPVLAELGHAVTKFPTWPTDPLHAAGVLNEEVGELNKEVLQLVYEPHKSSKDEVRKEALQAAAMALRFYRSLDVYEYTKQHQHSQAIDPAPPTKEQ